MKFIRRNLYLILFFILCLLTSYAIGRAGGGGGHGGGFGGGSGSPHGHGSGFSPLVIFVAICWGAYTLLTSVLLFLKVAKTDLLLDRISQEDDLWKPNLLKENAKDAFMKIQVAWQEKNMNKVKKIVTASLYNKYNALLNDMRARRETNYISDITISDVKIICCQDYKDNAKDRYVAHIKGNLIDYTFNHEHNNIVKNPDKENEDFEDAFYFIRSRDKWLLEDINNDPGFWVLVDAKSHREH